MAGKARVHELAKELGVTSKEVLNKLAEQGEYVKSASSTVEAPVARRLRDSFPGKDGGKPARNAEAEWVVRDGTHEPLIDADTFHAVQVKLARRKRGRQRQKRVFSAAWIVCRLDADHLE